MESKEILKYVYHTLLRVDSTWQEIFIAHGAAHLGTSRLVQIQKQKDLK